jgi:ATP-dependent protease Clp ATPase subunit
MKTAPKIDVRIQSLVLALGRCLVDCCEDGPGPAARKAPSAEFPQGVDAMVEGIVAAVGNDAAVRRRVGIGQRRLDPSRVRVRVCAVAALGWNALREDIGKMDIGELAAIVGDQRLPPAESLLHARHEIGVLLQESVLQSTPDSERPAFLTASLPTSTLVWLSGTDSLGYLTVVHASRAAASRGDQSDDAPAAGAQPLPSARDLFERVRVRVWGCDEQLKTLAARMILSATRAEMVSRGVEDTGVGVQAAVVFGCSGSGKTWAATELARCSQLDYTTFDAASITGEGWSGAKAEDAFKQLATRRSSRAGKVVVYDEIDKILKAGSAEHLRSAQASFLRALGGETIVCGGKRMQDCWPFSFNCNSVFFALVGVFEGLAEMAYGKSGRRAIGFCCREGARRHADFRRALSEYGCIDELVNRVGCFVGMPDPTHDAIAHWVVSEHGAIESYNRVLQGHNVFLYPVEAAVMMLADYGLQSRSYFRGVKHLLGTVVEEVLLDGQKGTVVLDATLVRRAIDRSSGVDCSASPPRQARGQDDGCERDGQAGEALLAGAG